MVEPARPVIAYEFAPLRVSEEPRPSRLAIAALPAALVGSPCGALPIVVLGMSPMNVVLFWAVVAAAPTLAVGALIRVRTSRGQLVGAGLAVAGLVIFGVTWAAVLLLLWRVGLPSC